MVHVHLILHSAILVQVYFEEDNEVLIAWYLMYFGSDAQMCLSNDFTNYMLLVALEVALNHLCMYRHHPSVEVALDPY
jgi:hypothetical protein